MASCTALVQLSIALSSRFWAQVRGVEELAAQDAPRLAARLGLSRQQLQRLSPLSRAHAAAHEGGMLALDDHRGAVT
ncbi:hypothetical protein T484DRAFT_1847045 [Baffinella frigidus]|nr:hypothetical protein T484DRAFT_1847045 [Cryptophyta sp. CCMP2293]